MAMGAVPYRDIVDVNMPLTYHLHAAVVAIGGMSDVAWRAFDLTAAAVMSACIWMLVAPAGRAVATWPCSRVGDPSLAWPLLGRTARLSHVDSGPDGRLGVGRDRGRPEHRWLYLALTGAFAVIAASIKPSGMLLLLLPALATRLSGASSGATSPGHGGAAGTGLLVLGMLIAAGNWVR
jgi:hypothetical protein